MLIQRWDMDLILLSLKKKTQKHILYKLNTLDVTLTEILLPMCISVRNRQKIIALKALTLNQLFTVFSQLERVLVLNTICSHTPVTFK